MARPIDQEPLREVASKVVEDGKTYLRAEVNLVRQIATEKVRLAIPATIMIVAALFLLQAALTVLVAALGMTLAIWVGVAGGLAIGAAIVLVVAAILALVAINLIKRII